MESQRPRPLSPAALLGAAGGALLAGLLAWAWIALSGVGVAARDGPIGSLHPSVSMRDARLSVSHRGQRRWVIRADQVSVSADRRVTTVRGLRDGRLYHQGRVWLTCSAGQAVLLEPEGRLTLSGGLKARARDGSLLVTEGLEWFSDQDRLVCPRPIAITGPWGGLWMASLAGDVSSRRLLGSSPRVRLRLPDKLSKEEEAQLQ